MLLPLLLLLPLLPLLVPPVLGVLAGMLLLLQALGGSFAAVVVVLGPGKELAGAVRGQRRSVAAARPEKEESEEKKTLTDRQRGFHGG